jgi:hypothetical protein
VQSAVNGVKGHFAVGLMSKFNSWAGFTRRFDKRKVLSGVAAPRRVFRTAGSGDFALL